MYRARLALVLAVLTASGCAPAQSGGASALRMEYVCADGSHNWHCDRFKGV